jgi:hypothetical protein
VSIARVEPLTSARALRGPFDYRLPEAMEGLEVGSVVLVPFGRRRVLGVVVERAERSELPPERLSEPIEALEAGAPAELVWRGSCRREPAPPGSGSGRGSSCGRRSPRPVRRRCAAASGSGFASAPCSSR